MADGTSPNLHAFRLVCKAFSPVGKKAWEILAKQHPKSGYTTLCLAPRKNSPEYDLAGCWQIMNALTNRHNFTCMDMDLPYDSRLSGSQDIHQFEGYLARTLRVTKVTSMHSHVNAIYSERNTIMTAFCNAEHLTALTLSMNTGSCRAELDLDILSEIPVVPALNTFCSTDMVLDWDWRETYSDTNLPKFLSAHRATLRGVRLRGIAEDESLILNPGTSCVRHSSFRNATYTLSGLGMPMRTPVP